MADILGLVQDAVLARIADENLGFNASFNTLKATKPAYQELDAMVIAYDGSSTNFNLGRVDSKSIIESSDFEFPYQMLEIRSGTNDQGGQQIKFTEFSGLVQMELETIVSWPEESVRDFESLPNCVAGALSSTFNNINAPNDWGCGVVYAGQFSVTKSQTQFGGENWFKSILMRAAFRVVTV